MWLSKAAGRLGWRSDLVMRLGARGWESWWQRRPKPLTGSAQAAGLAGDLTDPIQHLRSQLQLRLQEANALPQVTVVLDSAVAPMMLLDTGLSVLSEPIVRAHAQNRLHAVHGGLAAEPSSLELRVDWNAGERFGLEYGLSAHLLAQLRFAVAEQGAHLKSVVPGFAWGMARLRPWRRWPRGTGWWVWREQDRQLVARITAGRVTALHPALPLAKDFEGVRTQIRVESLRWGTPSDSAPIAVGACAWSQLSNICEPGELELQSVFNDSGAPLPTPMLLQPSRI